MKKLLLFSLLFSALLFVSILFVFYQVSNGKMNNPFSPEVYESVSDIPSDKMEELSVSIDDFTSNTKNQRFIKLKLTFVSDSKEGQEELTNRLDYIKSDLILYINDKSTSEFQGSKNLNIARKDIQNIINNQMKNGSVVGVYFTDLILQ